MDSQGRIAFDVDGQNDPANPADPTAEDPFIFVRDYTPAGSDPAAAEAETAPVEPVVPPRPPVPEAPTSAAPEPAEAAPETPASAA